MLGGAAIAQDPAATETATPSSTPTPRRHGDPGRAHPHRHRDAELDADLLAHADGHAHRLLHALPHAGAAHALPLARGDGGRHAHARRHATATPGGLGLDLSKGSRKRDKRRNGKSGSGAIVDQGCLDGKKNEVEVGEEVRRTRRYGSGLDLDHSFRVRPSRLEGSRGRPRRRHPPRDRARRRHPDPREPGYALATPGAAPIGVPNFFIDKFRIPPFLLPVYQAAGIEYGVRWEVLAAINEIETDYGRNLNVSTAGALGWMQFMPATWKQYGVDANRDGLEDPYNPVDAIFAAARYLRAAGAETDIRRAIFAYNHADWYVDSVLMRARLIGGLPSNFVGSLTGLTQGRFPVHAKATYAGQVEKGGKKAKDGENAALVVESQQDRRGIKIFARRGAPVVAVNDGRIVRKGETERLGKFIQLQDSYGNTYTYGHLGKVADTYPAPKPRKTTKKQIAKELELPSADAKPTAAASADLAPDAARQPARTRPPHQAARDAHAGRRRAAGRRARQAAPVRPPVAPERDGRGRRRAARRLLLARRLGPDRPRRQGLRQEAAQEGLARRRRHDPRPHRQDRPDARPPTSCSSSARPAAAPRASIRSRSSTAGSCSSRPRSTAPRARTRSSATTPRSPRSARSC